MGLELNAGMYEPTNEELTMLHTAPWSEPLRAAASPRMPSGAAPEANEEPEADELERFYSDPPCTD